VKRELIQKIQHRADHFHYSAACLGVNGELPARPEGEPKDTAEWNDYYSVMTGGCIW
jgi:hypothetical protein